MPQSALATPVRAAAGTARATPAIAGALGRLLEADATTWPVRGFVAVKQRSVRSVLHGPLDGIPVHIKVFRGGSLSERALRALRKAPGDREADHLAALRAAGFPAVEPLAAGFCQHDGVRCSFVVTATLADAQPFHFGLPDATRHAAGVLLRQLHEAGLQPGDLHPGNLLVSQSGSLHLLDLTSVRHSGTPSLRQRAAALALFAHQLDAGPLEPAARPLLAGYLANGGDLGEAFRDQLRLATHRWHARNLPAFGRRASRDCRHTAVERRRRGQPQWFWHLPTTADAAVQAQLRDRLAALPAPTKHGRRGAVWLLPDLVVKLRDRGAAQKLWRASYWLLYAQVPAAAPLALRLSHDQGYLVHARVANVSLAAELTAGTLAATACLTTAKALGTAVGRLHAHGLRNRDLKFDNLVREPASGQVVMVDLDGIQRRSTRDSRALGADLGRLLAAFRGAGAPGGRATVRAFLRAWLRAHRGLLQTPPVRRVLARAEVRAGEWASAHRP